MMDFDMGGKPFMPGSFFSKLIKYWFQGSCSREKFAAPVLIPDGMKIIPCGIRAIPFGIIDFL